jgi:CRP-like cAMP-binding protein
MTKKKSIPISQTKQHTDSDGNAINNKILLSLSHKECNRVLSEMELVRLKPRHVVHEAGETLKSGYFVSTGAISVLAVQPDGNSIEVSLIGNEGFTALPLLVGFHTSPTRLMTLGEVTAYRCDAGVLKVLVQQCPQLERQLHHFGQRLAMQTIQIAACNQFHDVEERLARWILMSHDRVSSDNLLLTQEFMAQMLGIRRASVSAAAGILQKAGSISYTRGSIRILNRKRLEGAACDCYGIVQRQIESWETEK